MADPASMDPRTRLVLEIEGVLNNPQDCPSSRLRAEKIVRKTEAFFLEGPEKYVFAESKPWPETNWAPTQAELNAPQPESHALPTPNYDDFDFNF